MWTKLTQFLFLLLLITVSSHFWATFHFLEGFLLSIASLICYPIWLFIFEYSMSILPQHNFLKIHIFIDSHIHGKVSNDKDNFLVREKIIFSPSACIPPDSQRITHWHFHGINHIFIKLSWLSLYMLHKNKKRKDVVPVLEWLYSYCIATAIYIL